MAAASPREHARNAAASASSAAAIAADAALPAAESVLSDLPPVSALFLIDFDVKAGYTVVWKRTIPGLEVDGQVEYKSLPSGLHDVAEDLVYFVHDGGHAGLSAFINAKTGDDAARNARMIAVGVLVPLSYGRLGRAWRHAEALQDLARFALLSPSRAMTKALPTRPAADGSRPSLSMQKPRCRPKSARSLGKVLGDNRGAQPLA